MSSMPDHKAPPDLDLTYVRQKIEMLKKELSAWQAHEQRLAAIKEEEPSMVITGIFNAKPYPAICAFLEYQGVPQTRFAIIKALIHGKALLGANKEKSINQSISTNVGLGKLKEINDLVGMTQWPDEMFEAG